MGLVALGVILDPSNVLAQARSGTLPDALPQAQFDLLKSALGSGMLERVPSIVFPDGLFDKNLAQLVIYLPADRNKARVRLVQGGKGVDDLRGARNVWVMLYADSDLVHTGQEARVESTLTVHLGRLPASSDSNTTLSTSLRKRKLPPPIVSSLPPDTTWSTSTTHQSQPNPTTKDRVVNKVRTTFSTGVDSLETRHTTLAYERDPAEASLLGLLEKILSAVKPADEPPAKVEDKETKVVLEKLVPATEGSSERLYHLMEKIPLDRKTVNRVTVKVGEHRVQATFGNYSASPLGASVGVLATLGHKNDPAPGGTSVSAAGFFHIYVWRPVAPTGYRARFLGAGSGSVVLGTKLKSDLDTGFAGISLGHFFSQAGLVLGVNFRSGDTKDARPRHIWKGAPAIGLTYVL